MSEQQQSPARGHPGGSVEMSGPWWAQCEQSDMGFYFNKTNRINIWDSHAIDDNILDDNVMDDKIWDNMTTSGRVDKDLGW